MMFTKFQSNKHFSINFIRNIIPFKLLFAVCILSFNSCTSGTNKDNKEKIIRHLDKGKKCDSIIERLYHSFGRLDDSFCNLDTESKKMHISNFNSFLNVFKIHSFKQNEIKLKIISNFSKFDVVNGFLVTDPRKNSKIIFKSGSVEKKIVLQIMENFRIMSVKIKQCLLYEKYFKDKILKLDNKLLEDVKKAKRWDWFDTINYVEDTFIDMYSIIEMGLEDFMREHKCKI